MTINEIIGNKEKTSIIDTELWKKMNEKYSGIETKTEEETMPIIEKLKQEIDYTKYGKIFYNDERGMGNNRVGKAIALAQALEYATPKGYVATLPELIASKIKSGKTHDFWQEAYDVQTEESIGIYNKGLFYKKNKPVLVIVNGGGILTPKRIETAYTDGLINGYVKYTQKEFNDLINGKLPDNTEIQLYTFEEIKKGISNLPHQFGVITPYKIVQEITSERHHRSDCFNTYQKDAFITNPLAIARAGGIENLEKYYELAKHSDGRLGCDHTNYGKNPSTPIGHLLSLQKDYCGLLNGDGFYSSGRFIALAPENIAKKIINKIK